MKSLLASVLLIITCPLTGKSQDLYDITIQKSPQLNVVSNESGSFNSFTRKFTDVKLFPSAISLFSEDDDALATESPDRQPEMNENPAGLYAGLFFGRSSLSYGFDQEFIRISQMQFGKGRDSTLVIPDHIDATVNTDEKNLNYNLDAGIYLGYFPGFLTFEFNEQNILGFGAMTKLGLSFKDGFGGWLGAGPEVSYRHNALSFSTGYMFSWVGGDHTLGSLNLEGADIFIVESSRPPENPCDMEAYKSDSPFCRIHDDNSSLKTGGSATAGVPYFRFGYDFSRGVNPAGIGIVVGYRVANNRDVTYFLESEYEKSSTYNQNELHGPEFTPFENAFDYSGFFIELELYTKPF